MVMADIVVVVVRSLGVGAAGGLYKGGSRDVISLNNDVSCCTNIIIEIHYYNNYIQALTGIYKVRMQICLNGQVFCLFVFQMGCVHCFQSNPHMYRY